MCILKFIVRNPTGRCSLQLMWGWATIREAPMEDQQYFLQKANRCFSIARACMDLDAARKINELGNEFLKVAKLERRDARLPFRDSDRDFAA